MRIWDTELLMQRKPSELVTDGLLAWIDGRDAPTASKQIYERVSASYITPLNQGTAWTLSQSDGLYLSIAASGWAFAAYRASGGTAQTIEMVTGMRTSHAKCIAQQTDYRCMLRYADASAGRTNYVGYKVSGVSDVQYLWPDVPPMHVVLRPHAITINGVTTTESRVILTGYNILMMIDMSNGQYEQIGAIRTYNRELTDAEIAQNIAYERSIGRLQ